jgi:hypothetical protein
VLGLAALDDQPVDSLAEAISARTLPIGFVIGGALSALPDLVVSARHAQCGSRSASWFWWSPPVRSGNRCSR